MSEIIDHVAPRSMILFNESFAATNEREGFRDRQADNIRPLGEIGQNDLCDPSL